MGAVTRGRIEAGQWHSCFALLLVYGAAIFFGSLWEQEQTGKRKTRGMKPIPMSPQGPDLFRRESGVFWFVSFF
jgi:hypothetical protein